MSLGWPGICALAFFWFTLPGKTTLGGVLAFLQFPFSQLHAGVYGVLSCKNVYMLACVGMAQLFPISARGFPESNKCTCWQAVLTRCWDIKSTGKVHLMHPYADRADSWHTETPIRLNVQELMSYWRSVKIHTLGVPPSILALQLELAQHRRRAGGCVHAYCCMHGGAHKPGLDPPLLGQELGCGPRSKGSWATGRGVPSLSYESCAILHGLREGSVDHGAEKWFPFRAGGQREQEGEEHVSVPAQSNVYVFYIKPSLDETYRCSDASQLCLPCCQEGFSH